MNSERIQSLLVGALVAVVIAATAVLLVLHQREPDSGHASRRTDLDTSSKAPIGMLHYVAGPDDDFVFRYQAGSCREAGGPMLELTDDGGWSFRPIRLPQVDDGTGVGASTPTITSVVTLSLEGRHRFVLSGTDDKCRVHTYTTTDAGVSWRQKPFKADSWYVDPKSGVVYSPSGPANVDCPGIANLTGFDDDSAVVYCIDGTVYQSSDGKTWDRSGSSDEAATSVFFDSVDDGYAVWPDGNCKSRVFRTANGGSSWSKRGCVYAETLIPGIGGSDDTLMAGGNGAVWTSTDNGESWDRPKNPDDDSDITNKLNGGGSTDESPTPSDTDSASPSPSESASATSEPDEEP